MRQRTTTGPEHLRMASGFTRARLQSTLPALAVAAVLIVMRASPGKAQSSGIQTNRPSLASESKTAPTIGWQDLTNGTYRTYLLRLRQAGCPEAHVRRIVLDDVNEHFAQRRRQRAIQNDPKWWKSETYSGTLPLPTSSPGDLNAERALLLTGLLGAEEASRLKLPSLNDATLEVTGPILGSLPLERWRSLQEIYHRSVEQHLAYHQARANGESPVDLTELARLRAQTREELARLLTPEELEEFLLRYSQNAMQLRQELSGFEVIPSEFRRLFAALDPLDRRMQEDFGGPEMLSAGQREKHQSRRQQAFREALSPARYEEFLLSKDPVLHQARSTATTFRMNERAVKPLYQLHKSMESRRHELATNEMLSASQRAEAEKGLDLEMQQRLHRLLQDPAYHQ